MRYVPSSLVSLFNTTPIWVRSIASTLYGSLKKRREKTGKFWRYFHEVEKSQWWPASRLEELQCQRLRALILHSSQNIEYYKHMFAEYGINPSQIQTPNDLKILPTLSKETVRNEWPRLMAPGYRRSRLRSESTSGTTGTPLTVWMTDETYLRQKAVQWLQYSWAGYTGRQWVGVFGGYKIVPLTRHRPPFWIVNHAGRQVHFSTYHLNPDFLPHVVAKLESSNIQYLMGYPSAIGIVAQYLASRNQCVSLKGVFLSSEPIYDWHVEAIRQGFGCRVFNYFAATEKVVSAISCGHSLNLHVNEEICIPEFTPATLVDGRRVLLGTLLTNYAMPLIRYELHDVSSEVPTPCPCGRAHGLIGPIDTKAEDFIVTPHGSLVSASLLTFPFKTARGIIASQIVQLDLTTLMVNVVTNELFRPEDATKLCADIGSCVGDEMRIEITRVADIPRTNNGKFKFVVSALSKDHVLDLLA